MRNPNVADSVGSEYTDYGLYGFIVVKTTVACNDDADNAERIQ